MMLFAFGITPKLTLHNLVATHKDVKAKNVHVAHSDTQIAKSGFNCQCDNLVIESPFVNTYTAIQVSPVIVFATYQKVFVETVFSTVMYRSPLRGPPAC